jgi:hypothetical protein
MLRLSYFPDNHLTDSGEVVNVVHWLPFTLPEHLDGETDENHGRILVRNASVPAEI